MWRRVFVLPAIFALVASSSICPEAGFVGWAIARLYAAARADDAGADLLHSMHSDAKTFIARARAEKISVVAQVETLNATRRLISARDGFFNQRLRLIEGAEMLAQAADPTIISQGAHETCNVTSLEERMFTVAPAEAADLIVSATLTRKWTNPAGVVIEVRDGTIIPGPEELKYPVPLLERSLASEVFQVVALDAVGQSATPPIYDPVTSQRIRGPVHFAQHLPRLKLDDLGEYWIREDGTVAAPFLGLTLDGLEIAARFLFGSVSTPYIMVSTSFAKDPIVSNFESASDFGQVLEQLFSHHQLPALMLVKARDPALTGKPYPFPEMIDHVIVVAKLDTAGSRAYVVNPWGKPFDRWVSLDKLRDAATVFYFHMHHA